MTDLKFFEQLDLVDELVQSVNDIGYELAFKKITPHFDTPYVCQYFFESIEGHEWVDVIIESVFLKKCRSGEIPSLKNNQFDWLLLGYLATVSDTKPYQLYEYLSSLAAADEARLRERMLAVTVLLPCDLAAALTQEEVRWCDTRERLDGLYPDLAGKLILHVQECDEEVALGLIKQLLKVGSNTREIGDPGTDRHHKSVDVEAKFSDWAYQSFLKTYVEKFVLGSEASIPHLFYLFDHLTNVLRLENRDPENDASWMWRNTFEDNEQTRHVSGIKEYLLVFLRDLSIRLIEDENRKFEEISQRLNKSEWSILNRLSMYLSVKFPEIDLERTKQLVANTGLYENVSTRNEYSLLLNTAFDLVGTDVQSTVYNWIDAGVDLEDYIKRFQEHKGKPPTEEDIQDYRAYWKKTRLHLIRKYIDGKRLTEYQSLVEEKGVPEHPEYSSYTKTWVGPTSPLSVDEINELELSDLIGRLKEWDPSGDHMAPSPEGLSRVLSEAIKVDIDKYKYLAANFKEVPPTYVRGVLQGFRDALPSLDDQAWPGIIDLSVWVLSQQDDAEAQKNLAEYEGEDPGWSWCRKAIAGLLNAGLKKGESQIPTALREDVWSLIYPLTQDSDPTPSHEAEYGGSNMEPTQMSINTVRGEAMHALIEYGLWITRNTVNRQSSFEDIPEMKEVLDNRLDPKVEPSLTIRSVYGQYFPWLNLMDTDWAKDAKLRIFSDDQDGLGDAAWNAYITFCQPYDDMLKIMPEIYSRYGSKLSEIEEDDGRDRSLENYVAHLITFYWRSKLDIDNEIVQVFYADAPLSLRKYAIDFIGRSLGNTPGGVEEGIEERLKELYDWRQEEVRNSSEYEELEGICWWIDADVVDREWALSKLHELLKVQDKIEDIDFAARKLTVYLDTDPKMVLECLSMMLEKLRIPGIYFTWDDEAQKILKVALTQEEVKEQAIELVHRFGSKGFLKYRDLLKAT